MKPRSAKAKGRKLQNRIAEDIRQKFNLVESDCSPTPMGQAGADIQLSSVVRDVFPFAVECKNRERLNIWQALDQAERNRGDLTPLLCFKRNHSEVYVCLKRADFLRLL